LNLICINDSTYSHVRARISNILTFLSLLVTLQTTFKKFYVVLTPFLGVLYGSRNKQRLLSYTVLADCISIIEVESVYCAVQTESLYNIDDCLYFARIAIPALLQCNRCQTLQFCEERLVFIL